MLYSFNFEDFPKIHHAYSVSRTTTWQIADNYNILIFISGGCCEISCNNENYILEKGDVFFIPAQQAYKRRPINDIICTMHYIHFTTSYEPTQTEPKLLQNFLAEARHNINTDALSDQPIQYPNTIFLKNRIRNTNYDKVLKLIDGINMFSSDRNIMSGLESQVNLSSLLVYLSHVTIKDFLSDTSIKNSVSYPDKLKKAINYIVRHSNKQITLDELAEHCHVSKHQMIRYFKNFLGTTPINYITDYKIAKAKEMLFHQSPLSIKEISEELGFSNQYYFTKVFTKTTGETPSAYRHRTINYEKNSQK